MNAPPNAAAAPAKSVSRMPVQRKPMSDLDRQFLPAAIEIIDSPPSPVKVALIWTICLFFLVLLLWSYFGKLDIFAIAPGKVQPIGRSKIVQPLEPGKVAAVLVENGVRVNEGQALIELDATEVGADRQALAQELKATNAEISRRRMAIALASERVAPGTMIEFPPDLPASIRERETSVLAADLAELAQARSTLTAQLEEQAAANRRLIASTTAREKLLTLSQERIDMRQSLKNLGVGSRALVIEAQQQYESAMITDQSERGQLVEVAAAQQTIAQRLIETTTRFLADQAQKLSEAERKADKLEQDLIKSEAKLARMTLRAPITGYVQELSVTTIGQVLSAGQTALSVVPEDAPMEIEVLIGNQDIGFVEVGQRVTVKVDAFPFTRYGTLDGTVVKLSRDAVDDESINDQQAAQSRAVQPGTANRRTLSKPQRLVFPATILLKERSMKAGNKEIPLVPGMSLSAEIRTGSRRAIDYLLSPLRETTARLGTER